jgi:hypothetical protein
VAPLDLRELLVLRELLDLLDLLAPLDLKVLRDLLENVFVISLIFQMVKFLQMHQMELIGSFV